MLHRTDRTKIVKEKEEKIHTIKARQSEKLKRTETTLLYSYDVRQFKSAWMGSTSCMPTSQSVHHQIIDNGQLIKSNNHLR